MKCFFVNDKLHLSECLSLVLCKVVPIRIVGFLSTATSCPAYAVWTIRVDWLGILL